MKISFATAQTTPELHGVNRHAPERSLGWGRRGQADFCSPLHLRSAGIRSAAGWPRMTPLPHPLLPGTRTLLLRLMHKMAQGPKWAGERLPPSPQASTSPTSASIPFPSRLQGVEKQAWYGENVWTVLQPPTHQETPGKGNSKVCSLARREGPQMEGPWCKKSEDGGNSWHWKKHRLITNKACSAGVGGERIPDKDAWGSEIDDGEFQHRKIYGCSKRRMKALALRN